MKIAIITLLFTSLVVAAPSANPLPESSAAVRLPTSFIPHSVLLLTQVLETSRPKRTGNIHPGSRGLGGKAISGVLLRLPRWTVRALYLQSGA
jgi:hypothetical protein